MGVITEMGLTGFQHRTRFIVRENDKEVVKSFEDYNDGDTVTVKDINNNWIEGTVSCSDKEMVMYRVVLSNKKYRDADKTYFDFKGHHYTSDGVPYGILENAEDDSPAKKRTYTGVGYAIIEKYKEKIDETVETEGSQVPESLYAYSLYDYKNTLIQKGLTLKELEMLVSSLSHISHEELNQRIHDKKLTEEGTTHHVNVTPAQRWFLSDGYTTLFLREGELLFDRSKYDEKDPSTSGYTWYVDDITVHRAMEEKPWRIKAESYQLEYGFVVR